MNLNHITNKQSGDPVSATEWNNLAADVNELGSGGSPSAVIDTSGLLSVSSKGNVTLGSNKNVNIEPKWNNNTQNYSGNYGDVAIKPGDDIQFCSHHREPKKRDKVVIKTIDGSDNPVKMEVGCGEITLSTKGKANTLKKDKTTGSDINNNYMFKASDANVMDINIITGNVLDLNEENERDERGYLKVRAQAIDLRCEKHGGIALQPKGYDSDGNMNKIKFEHGGGDGLEFGTFNTEKTSLYTDEYRFKRDGVWKMATRITEASGKNIIDEGTIPYGKNATGLLKYKKNNVNNQLVGYEPADDFYDFINIADEQCTTKDIIKTAFALNGGKNRHTKITNSGNIEIATNITYLIISAETPGDLSTVVPINSISAKLNGLELAAGQVYNEGDFDTLPVNATVYTDGTLYFTFTIIPAPTIKIDSGGELKLGGILDFGSSFNFGETDNGIEVQYKLTKKNATKDCGVLKVVGVNNHSSNNLTVEGVTIAPGQTDVIALCSLLDIIKLVNYMKTNNEGPWATQL